MKIFKKRCYNGGQKHKFRPRFSEKPNSGFSTRSVRGCTATEIRSFFFFNVYEKDICEWCGKTVNK